MAGTATMGSWGSMGRSWEYGGTKKNCKGMSELNERGALVMWPGRQSGGGGGWWQ